MQSDQKLDASLLSTDSWNREPVTGRTASDINRIKLPSLERGKLSFSGNERNHLFQNYHGDTFQDISGLSGLDTLQDGRTFAVWDFDRDGWQDIALLNVNTPVLNLFRNQHGELRESGRPQSNMVAFKFVGGNREGRASTEFCSRDGYGARVMLTEGDRTLVQQHRCGEGLASQNSSTMFFGIGESETIDSAEVVWPSGITQTLTSIDAGSLITVFENESETDDETGFVVTRYLLDKKDAANQQTKRTISKPFKQLAETKSELLMYTSVATWCPNCRKRLPQLALLRDHFSDGELAMVGLPIDENDNETKLTAYLEKHQPPYELHRSATPTERQAFSESVIQKIGSDVLPATLIMDGKGTVLSVIAGVPTISDLKQLLAR